MSITWFGGSHYYGIVSLSGISDQEGIADATAYVPSNTISLMIVATHGYTTFPSSPQTTSARIMPYGYNSFSPGLERAVSLYTAGGVDPGLGLVNQNIVMPVYNGVAKFYWNLRSSDSTTSNKSFYISLYGYET